MTSILGNVVSFILAYIAAVQAAVTISNGPKR